jgi:hypothetical protein
MANEPYNEVVYKAAEKLIANPSGTVATPVVVVGNIADNAVDSGAPVKVGGRVDDTLDTYAAGDRADLSMSTRGLLRTQLFGTNIQGVDGINNGNCITIGFESGVASNAFPLIVAPVKFNGTTFDRDRKPNASSRIPSSANTTNPTSAKAAAGDLINVMGYNSSATVAYLKVYNKASAPTVGTDVPVLTLPLPPTAAFAFDFASLYFSTGIAYGLTTDAADAGTTAVAAGAILGLCVVYA